MILKETSKYHDVPVQVPTSLPVVPVVFLLL